MKKIKIIKLPPGMVPKKFRRAWLNETFDIVAVLGESNQVNAEQAIKQLRTHRKKAAANFWQGLAGKGNFGFPKNVCKEIE